MRHFCMLFFNFIHFIDFCIEIFIYSLEFSSRNYL